MIGTEEHGLGTFFARLDIDNFLDGQPEGEYGSDYAHFGLGDLDAMVRRSGEGGCCLGLVHTTRSPSVQRVRVVPGVTASEVVFGDPQHPYRFAGNIKYAFIWARADNGRTLVMTRVGEGMSAVEREYTLAQLYELLGL